MSSAGKSTWKPDSWQSLPAIQQPAYADSAHVDRVVAQLGKLPPLVTSWEIEALREKIVAAQQGRAFVLQGGDCSENFDECTSENIVRKLKILLQMSVVMTAGLTRPIIRIGRMAGQFAKPRSADMEKRDGVSLPSYRGDLVNRMAFNRSDREPDPELMLRGYERAALTVNFIRSLIDGGFADLHHPENWDLDFVSHSASAAEYHYLVERIADSLDFFESITGTKINQAQRVDFYTSHEALHLLYEQAQTRFLEHRDEWYNLTTHFPWIGMRTADPGGAHVEYCRGIRNPIGIKVGSGMTDEDLQHLIVTLNPNGEEGRLALIHRFGAGHIDEHLPRLIKTVTALEVPVLWMCDPMHGNTESVTGGRKTRRLDNIIGEIESAFRIHDEAGSILSGVHLELTGDHVTECVGGARGLDEQDLERAYLTQVDPRLNYEQAMEVALRIADRATATRSA
ncbi:MAG: 3-deoxy-7-phosphoheptulonate synthase class II [Gammaproteobacteria bacterium]|jgi:3-deoxy-7-phosphoheptulonate synthase|nr:3-deoxy-7-phosphoheptulonate synthase class II [Chromatiales bacterium]MDP6674400.1 3-deoxy-7-phosphoheptulonate synthase class II [Gammaproteobacteria bacterium]